MRKSISQEFQDYIRTNLPTPFTSADATRIAETLQISFNTVIKYGKEMGKGYKDGTGIVSWERPSEAKRRLKLESREESVRYTIPKMIESGDRVQIIEPVDGLEFRGKWGRLLSYHPDSGFFKVKMDDEGEIVVAYKVLKEGHVSHRTLHRYARKHLDKKFIRFILDYKQATGLNHPRITEIFNLGWGTSFNYQRKFQDHPEQFPLYSESDVAKWTQEYHLGGDETPTESIGDAKEEEFIVPERTTSVHTTTISHRAIFQDGEVIVELVLGEDQRVSIPVRLRGEEEYSIDLSRGIDGLRSFIAILEEVKFMFEQTTPKEGSE